MAHDDEQARRSRVVVETPTSRREVTHTEAVRNDREGISGATVGIIVVVAIALITIVVLFLMNGQNTDTTNANLAAQQQPAAQTQSQPTSYSNGNSFTYNYGNAGAGNQQTTYGVDAGAGWGGDYGGYA